MTLPILWTIARAAGDRGAEHGGAEAYPALEAFLLTRSRNCGRYVNVKTAGAVARWVSERVLARYHLQREGICYVVDFQSLILLAGVLILCSVVASRLSDKYGIPALVVFLAIGMLAGSDGPGGIHFDDAALANVVGMIGLAFILFSGGLDTNWQVVRPVFWRGILLSTVGVAITAGVIGLFSWAVLGFNLITGLLFGSIVSSTDAAAVFSIMRRRGVSLKGNLKPLLEFESGSNDPMAVLLTMTMTSILTAQDFNWLSLPQAFVINMFGGIAMGLAAGWLAKILFNNIHLDYEGLYPVLSIGVVLMTFGLSNYLRCNEFIAVYVCGIMLNTSEFRYHLYVMRFHDGLAWLMQIILFVVLGLLVFPSQLFGVALWALLASVVLMFVARPAAVAICLWRSEFSLPQRALTAWTGLRGAVPIVLATFPLAAGYEGSATIFNIVFFIVLTSVLIQGIMLMPIARWLKVDEPMAVPPKFSLEIQREGQLQGETREIEILPNMAAAGKTIAELDIPPDVLILLIGRGDQSFVPKGQTRMEPYDTILMLGDRGAVKKAGDAVLSPRPKVRQQAPLADPLAMLPADTDMKFLTKQVVIVGYGRVGRRIFGKLREYGIPCVIIDQDREIIQNLREQNVPAVTGDASTPMALAQGHVARAALLVITTANTMKVRRMAELAKQLNETIEVVILTRSEVEANLLKREGIGTIFHGDEELARNMTHFILQQMNT